MRKQLLTMMIWLASLATFGQAIPNAGFEQWTNMGLYSNPDAWTTPNNTTVALLITTVTQEATDPYEGSYSAKLTTTSAMFGQYTIPGFMTLGGYNFNLLTQEVKRYGGIAYPYKPTKLSLYYKYLPVKGDNWFIAVELFNTDTLTGKKTIVGGITKNIYDSTATWTLFETPIDFKPGTTADSLNIYILSSNLDTPQAGSVLIIDKLSFEINTSVNEPLPSETYITLFPNPASEFMAIRSTHEFIHEVAVFDMAGKHIKTFTLDSKEGHIDISGFEQGMYLIRTQLDNGSLQTQSLWVE